MLLLEAVVAFEFDEFAGSGAEVAVWGCEAVCAAVTLALAVAIAFNCALQDAVLCWMMQQLNCLFGNTVSLGHPVMENFEMMINCLFFLRYVCIFVESDDFIVNIIDK